MQVNVSQAFSRYMKDYEFKVTTTIINDRQEQEREIESSFMHKAYIHQSEVHDIIKTSDGEYTINPIVIFAKKDILKIGDIVVYLLKNWVVYRKSNKLDTGAYVRYKAQEVITSYD